MTTAAYFRSKFIDRPARRCRCGSARFHVPPAGGLRCSICSPGDSMLDLIAQPNRYGKLTWDEYYPDSGFSDDQPADNRPEPAPQSADAYDEIFRWEDPPMPVPYSRTIAKPAPLPPSTSAAPNVAEGQTVALTREQCTIGGMVHKAGGVYRVHRVYRTSHGWRASIMAISDGRTISNGRRIDCIELDRLEVIDQPQPEAAAIVPAATKQPECKMAVSLPEWL